MQVDDFLLDNRYFAIPFHVVICQAPLTVRLFEISVNCLLGSELMDTSAFCSKHCSTVSKAYFARQMLATAMLSFNQYVSLKFFLYSLALSMRVAKADSLKLLDPWLHDIVRHTNSCKNHGENMSQTLSQVSFRSKK